MMPYAFNEDRSKYDLSQKADVDSLSGKSDIGHTHDISELNIGILPVSKGGTGANTRLGSLGNLGFAKFEKSITLSSGNTGIIHWSADELSEAGIENPEDAVIVSLMRKAVNGNWETTSPLSSDPQHPTLVAGIDGDAMGSTTAMWARVYGIEDETYAIRVVLLDMSMELFPFGD